ncbi:MAG: isocitrate lyase/phosphoenolpyruvate mutase family protein, partial [Alphaproteobacteria bacterium]|nr:isocitrate lyase/phosphoenolpyruvate mutase family protein [Alphaproteobacteria bacterium]
MQQRPSTQLRERLAEDGMLIKPSAFNALSARLIEQAGFEVMGLSGAAVSASLLGKPDVGLVTLDEMVAVARYITGVTSVPLLADGGVGFGNAINTMRATEGFVRAGAAGIDISDRTGPGRYGDGRQTISLEEAVGKIRACAKVRDELDPDFLIVARTQAGVGLDEAIRRGNGYLAAGADMINDIWGLLRDPDMAGVAAETGVPAVLMHNQDHTNYADVVPDVVAVLRSLIERAVNAGVALENIVVDPGMGFGKTAEQNLEILRRLGEFESLG